MIPYQQSKFPYGDSAYSSSRLDKARNQYELLLLNAKNIVEPIHSSDDDRDIRVLDDNLLGGSSSSFRKRPSEVFGVRETEEELIFSMQNEIDRLKSKLNSVLQAAEKNCEEFQRAQVTCYGDLGTARIILRLG
jgi:hypothetical protein